MRIALITNDFIPNIGGVTNVMINISKKLTKMGENLYVFNKTYENNENLYFKVLSNTTSLKGIFYHNIKFFYFMFYLFLRIIFSFKGIKPKNRLKLAFFYCFYPKMIVRRIISIKNLVTSLKKQKIEIILSGTADIPLLYSFILSKWYNLPIVTIAHGDDFLKIYPYKIKNYIFQNIQKTIVTNKYMKNLFLKIYNLNSNKVNVIHLGVDIEDSEIHESAMELRRNFNISQDDFIILSVSRFYPRKGIDTVLKALKLIRDENFDIPIIYYIIGSGEDEPRIKKVISDLNLKDNVKLLGSVQEPLKNKYYKLSDLFILVPELRNNSIEGFGIVYIEANFFKIPVIGSRSGGVVIAIEDGKSGFLIPPMDEKSLKEKILLLYNNKQLCKDLGEYGHERVVKSFNWTKNAIIYRDVLKNAIREFKSKKC
ncbi:MAG: glycosyltransferase family 4 protein [Promethearchaeota archaeon]